MSNPVDPGTVFPSDEGGPGTGEPGADITDQPLPPLTPEEPFAAGTGSSLSNVPGGAPEAGDSPGQVAGGQIDPPTGRKARTAADRIAQLTKQYRQEQRARGDIETQLSEAVNILRQQGEELKALRSGGARPTARQEAADALGLGAGATEGQPAPNLTLDSIRGIIQSSLSDYEVRAQQRNLEIERMKASHEAAFKEAADEMPELLDHRSTARRAFDELYAVSPLRTLPDGPYQIALQVRGLLADEARRDASAAPQRKLQAGVVAPAGGPVDGLPDAQRASLRKEFEKLTQLRRGGNEDFQVYKRWRTIRDQLSRR